MPIVETRKLTKHFGEKTALRNINLKIDEADLFAIVGPSGSGKTTLLRLLGLLEKPSAGQIFFDGVDTACSENETLMLRRRIGIVFQQSVMFNSSVCDNVAYPLRIRGQSANLERKVSEALELVKLSGFETRRAMSLSGGEMQRVSLAQALIYEPRLLLLDEPTANLDPQNVAVIEEAVRKINRERRVAVVMATHNMLQVENLASTAAVLREGELAEVGTIDDIFRKPSDFVASFARLRNVYAGQARPVDQGLVIVDLGEGIKVEATTHKTGNVTVFIRPEEIIVSDAPIQSSARNVLKGRVIEVVDLDARVQIGVDAGKEFTATLTRRSFEEMRLTLGSQVYLSFKASGVHVI